VQTAYAVLKGPLIHGATEGNAPSLDICRTLTSLKGGSTTSKLSFPEGDIWWNRTGERPPHSQPAQLEDCTTLAGRRGVHLHRGVRPCFSPWPRHRFRRRLQPYGMQTVHPYVGAVKI